MDAVCVNRKNPLRMFDVNILYILLQIVFVAASAPAVAHIRSRKQGSVLVYSDSSSASDICCSLSRYFTGTK